MSRSGGNGGGKGGRNHRLNWMDTPDGGAHFGEWAIVADRGFRLPWVLQRRGFAVLRAHGNNSGAARFKTVETAKRWVEKRLAERSR